MRSGRRSPRRSARRTLAELARGRRSACILICDITRPVPNGLFLRPMIETLVASGIPLARISILVATGLHRPNEGKELEELVGDPWVMANVSVANHFADSRRGSRRSRPTPTRGTPVTIDRRFVEADLRIATGLIEPHFMAGWSGGRKVVAPGVAGLANHKDLPYGPLHGGSAGRAMQPGRQPTARGAVGDRSARSATSTR